MTMNAAGGQLKSQYNELSTLQEPAQEAEILAMPIIWAPNHRIGRNREGEPCVIIQTLDRGSRPVSKTTVLQNLRIRENVTCRISRPNGQSEDVHGTVIECTSDQ